MSPTASGTLPGGRRGPLVAVEGAAMVFGDDVNTDLLHPSYFFSLDAGTVRRGFLGAVGDKDAGGDRPRVLLAGDNFGCGSSRETTMQSLRLAGVQALVARSFGRIFFRNALCLGLMAFEAAEAAALAAEGEPVRVDPFAMVARNQASGRTIALTPLDPFWREVLEAGGMMAWLAGRGSLR